MAGVPLPMFQMQLAFAIGLAGIYFGWRGAMARMTGFVDKEYHTLVPDHVGMWISSRYIEEDKRHSFRS